MRNALGIGGLVLLAMVGSSAYSADKVVREGNKYTINGGVPAEKPKIVFEYGCVAPKNSVCQGKVCYDRVEKKAFTLDDKYVKFNCGYFPR